MTHATTNLKKVINTSLVNHPRCRQERILLYSAEINLQVPLETCLQKIPARHRIADPRPRRSVGQMRHTPVLGSGEVSQQN